MLEINNHEKIWGNDCQAEGTRYAKALKAERPWCVQEQSAD